MMESIATNLTQFAGIYLGFLVLPGIYLGYFVLPLLFRWVKKRLSTTSSEYAKPKPAQPIKNNQEAFGVREAIIERLSVIEHFKPKSDPVFNMASFGDRLWAKSLDIVIIQIFNFIFITYLIEPFITWDANWFSISLHILIGFIWYCFLFYAYESYFIHKLGFTIGKWVFGIQVVSSDGLYLSLKNSKTRARSSLSSGLYFFIYFPILQTYSLWKHYKEFKREGAVSWDTKVGSIVQQQNISTLRRIIATAVSIILLITSFMFEAAYKQWANEQIKHTLNRLETR